MPLSVIERHSVAIRGAQKVNVLPQLINIWQKLISILHTKGSSFAFNSSNFDKYDVNVIAQYNEVKISYFIINIKILIFEKQAKWAFWRDQDFFVYSVFCLQLCFNLHDTNIGNIVAIHSQQIIVCSLEMSSLFSSALSF